MLYPIIIFLFPVVRAFATLYPMATLFEAVVIDDHALAPKNELLENEEPKVPLPAL